MPIIRGPDQSNKSNEKTQRLDKTLRTAAPVDNVYEEKTVAVGRTSRATSSTAKQKDDEKTIVVGGRRSRPEGETQNFMDDPVAGWLVVVDGPGKGQSLKIGYGQNTIGRSSKQRIKLDFGDDQISRENHAILTYDPKGRKFYVQQGSGTNLVYLDELPVLSPTELIQKANIQIGNTILRFIDFCNEDFDWADTEMVED